MEDKIKFTARINFELLEKFRIISEAHNRSVNGELNTVLEDYIKANQDILDKQQSSKRWLLALYQVID